MGATLISTDPYVTVRWNSFSAYPDLDTGAAAANEADWDLALATDTPPGHTARLSLHVTSGNGGPWDLDVALPATCAAPLSGVPAAPGDINTDGTADAAVAYAQDGEPPVLNVYSGASGEVLTSTRLAPAGYTPIAAVAIPDFAGSPADEVAVLLTAPDRRPRVVVVDAGRGRRLNSFGLSRRAAYLGIEVLPRAEDAPATLAVLALKPTGAVRAIQRDAASGARLGYLAFGRSLDPAALVALPQESGSLVALVGNNTSGSLRALVRDADDGRLTRRLNLSASFAAVDAEAVLAPDGAPRLVVLAADPEAGTVHLLTADPVQGGPPLDFLLANLVEGRALARLGDIGGGPGIDVAALGVAADGTVVAAVADPISANLLAAPEFPGGYLTDDLIALRPGATLAALGRAAGDGSVLTLRHPATGAALGSIAVR